MKTLTVTKAIISDSKVIFKMSNNNTNNKTMNKMKTKTNNKTNNKITIKREQIKELLALAKRIEKPIQITIKVSLNQLHQIYIPSTSLKNDNGCRLENDELLYYDYNDKLWFDVCNIKYITNITIIF